MQQHDGDRSTTSKTEGSPVRVDSENLSLLRNSHTDDDEDEASDNDRLPSRAQAHGGSGSDAPGDERGLCLPSDPESCGGCCTWLAQNELARVLLRRRFLLMCGMMACLTVVFEFGSLHSKLLVSGLGMSEDRAAYVAAAFPIGCVIASVTGGWLLDRAQGTREGKVWSQRVSVGLVVGCMLTFVGLALVVATGGGGASGGSSGGGGTNTTALAEREPDGGGPSGRLGVTSAQAEEPPPVTFAQGLAIGLCGLSGLLVAFPYYVLGNSYAVQAGGAGHSSAAISVMDATGYLLTVVVSVGMFDPILHGVGDDDGGSKGGEGGHGHSNSGSLKWGMVCGIVAVVLAGGVACLVAFFALEEDD